MNGRVVRQVQRPSKVIPLSVPLSRFNVPPVDLMRPARDRAAAQVNDPAGLVRTPPRLKCSVGIDRQRAAGEVERAVRRRCPAAEAEAIFRVPLLNERVPPIVSEAEPPSSMRVASALDSVSESRRRPSRR